MQIPSHRRRGLHRQHTVKQLLARGHDVIVLDNLSAGHRPAVPNERLVVGDLRDIDHLDHLLVVNRIEAVIHFAAFTSVGESVANPAKYYTNNLVYSLNLIDRCRRNGIARFVFSSTAAVYGIPASVPIAEDSLHAPINPYGNSKLAIERVSQITRPPISSGSRCATLTPPGPRPMARLARITIRRRTSSPSCSKSHSAAPAHRGVRHGLSDARRHLRAITSTSTISPRLTSSHSTRSRRRRPSLSMSASVAATASAM